MASENKKKKYDTNLNKKKIPKLKEEVLFDFEEDEKDEVVEIITFLDESNAIEGEGEDALENSIEAWDYLQGEEVLTEENVLETHRILMRDLNPRIAGKYRDCDVWVGDRKCLDFSVIEIVMRNWLINQKANRTTEKEIKHAHVAFEHIHPFEDGNGRTGRILMNWQRLKAGLPVLIIHTGAEQMSYYQWFK